MAVVNFKLHPMPAGTRTWVRRFDTAAEAMAARDALLRSVLQPASIDLLKADGKYALLVQAGGSGAALDRYSKEMPDAEVMEGEAERALWRGIEELSAIFLRDYPLGAAVRIPCPLTEVGTVLESLPWPALARAGSGVVYGYFPDAAESRALGRGVVDFAPQVFREQNELWRSPGSDFEMMRKIKAMFDPEHLLNRGRLYGRI
jgi:FAD/FMN-containing dehydrogenase